MSLIRVNINNREFAANEGSSIFNIALNNGIEIPNLCSDDKLQPYGACGLCVVEVDGYPKLVRSCSTIAEDGMIIKTDTPRTIAARKTALKLLASDHRGDCRPPCVTACPAHTDCQGYVGLIANGQYEEAIKLVKDVIPLPATIGRICPHPCETACRRTNVEEPIAIADLKRFLGDMDIQRGTLLPEMKPSTGKKVAVVGAGPAGLSSAYFLAKNGHMVVIYEDNPCPGGMLRYGIPQYRLPKELLDEEINTLRKMGVEIKCNIKLGMDISITYLRKAYDAVFIAIGAWSSIDLGCNGQEAEGVMGGIEFLKKSTMAEPLYLGDRVVVIGGGNTAMDVARTAVRLGAENVKVLYRRTLEEMPADKTEIKEAEEEGVEFHFLVAPYEIIQDGNRARGVKCHRMKLGEPDASGRRRPVPVDGEEIIYDADIIISAVGQKVNAECVKELGLTRNGTVAVKPETFETSLKGVFAGGEAVTGPKIAIDAIAQGKNAADVIDSYLSGFIIPVSNPPYIVQQDLTEEDFKKFARLPRQHQNVMSHHERKLSFVPISETLYESEAVKEASRCLECGCQDYFECKLINYIHKYDVDTQAFKGEKHRENNTEAHPFILRNPDKCILCGLCYRTCDEVMGITALGLEGRGFDSKVIPEFGLPLGESTCIACGQCADVCPTGAIIEKEAVKKQVPVVFNNVKSVCNYCGVGCGIILQTKGSLVFKSLPDKSDGEGLLCSRGRFGITHINDENRIKNPVVRDKHNSVKIGFEDALSLVAKKLQLIKGQYGENSIAIFASPRFTNEEAFIIRKIAMVLNTGYVGTMSKSEIPGIESVLGYDASSSGYEELCSTDLILSVGGIVENHPIMGIKIKAASKRAKLISLSSAPTRMEEWAHLSLRLGDSLNFLKGFMKALIEMGYVNEKNIEKKANNYDELKEYVRDAVITEDILKVAKYYGNAAKAIIVIDDDTVTTDAIRLFADIAIITNKIAKPHRGIIIVRSECNTQGFIDLGIKTPGKHIIEQINSGNIKAAVVIGEDIAGANLNSARTLKKLDFMAVFDMFMTDTAEMANLVIPIGTFAESEGTFTRSDRKIQYINKAINPVMKRTTFDILARLAQYLGLEIHDSKQVTEMISNEVPAYSGFHTARMKGERIYIPCTRSNIHGEQTMYTNGYNKEDGKAYLMISVNGSMFREKCVYDTVYRSFESEMQKNDS